MKNEKSESILIYNRDLLKGLQTEVKINTIISVQLDGESLSFVANKTIKRECNTNRY